MTTKFHAPTTPYGLVDAYNRRAAATGSPRYARAAHGADYNGHSINVWWNDYRSYYIAEYTWAGRIVMCRGSLADCLESALNYYRTGALGASVHVCLREDDTEGEALCKAAPELVAGSEADDMGFYTWRHTVASRCAPDAANPGRLTMIFDLELLEAAGSEDDYAAALKAKYGRSYR